MSHHYHKKLGFLVLACWMLIIVSACQKRHADKVKISKTMTAFTEAPHWAKEAIWYQIFVERFRNGNPSNMPNLQTMEGALMDTIPTNWQPTPWEHNWYKREEWAMSEKLDFYRTIQMRRYGGDLQGVKEKIDYLKDLGINAVYFNPLNDAPSLHKYDARSYHHIDVCFGNDRDNDIALMASEDPSNPETWKWTNADKLFLEVINLMHEAGIKVVLDYSWNHTGTSFWAFQDIIKNGQTSSYKDWYEIKKLDDIHTTQNEFEYDGWFGIKSLPELKKIKQTEKKHGYAFEGNMPDPVKAHILAVSQRWMDPNGDGNTSDGIDGMRLDVAEHVPLGFWRDFRQFVRKVNPDFYLVGENWWTAWPDQLMDAEPWVRGDIFDAVMHYQWFKPARAYINQGDDKIALGTLYDDLEQLYAKYRPGTQLAMMNLVSSHDTERVLSGLYNSNKYKYQGKPSENKGYKTGKPNALAYQKLKALLLHQFTFVGAPHIWNGDEMGMWGADDPDNRKPMLWPDIDFEPETPLYKEQVDYHDKPAFNADVWKYYKNMCQLRKAHKPLMLGVCEFDRTFISSNIMVYKRTLGNESIIIMINGDDQEKIVDVSALKSFDKSIFKYEASITGSQLHLKGYGGIVLGNH